MKVYVVMYTGWHGDKGGCVEGVFSNPELAAQRAAQESTYPMWVEEWELDQ